MLGMVRCQSKNAICRKHSLSFTGDVRHTHKTTENRKKKTLSIQSKGIIIGRVSAMGVEIGKNQWESKYSEKILGRRLFWGFF